jgi:hypothetical protein
MPKMNRDSIFQFNHQGVPVTIIFGEEETPELRKNIRNILATAYKERMEQQWRAKNLDKQTPR